MHDPAPGRQPTTKELRVFGLLWAAFFGILGLLCWRPTALWVAAIYCAAALLFSMAFNRRDVALRVQVPSVVIPLLFALILLALRLVGRPMPVAATLWGLGVVVGMAVVAKPAAATALYRGWIEAAAPIGWSVTCVILGAVYYLLVTPIALVMRLVGREPLALRFDPDASTYWIERRPSPEVSRYFRQF